MAGRGGADQDGKHRDDHDRHRLQAQVVQRRRGRELRKRPAGGRPGTQASYPIQGWEDAGAMLPTPGVEAEIRAKILKGNTSSPSTETSRHGRSRKKGHLEPDAGEESTTRIMIDTFSAAGFDINRDLLQSYKFIEGQSLPQWRDAGYGGGCWWTGT